MTAYTYSDAKLKPFQIVSALPEDFTGNSRAAAIEMSADGRFLYATNPGHDSVVRFAVDAASGKLSDPIWVPSGGETPRFMTLSPSGDILYVANEQSDTIYKFAVSPEDGTLSVQDDVVETGSPVSIAFH